MIDEDEVDVDDYLLSMAAGLMNSEPTYDSTKHSSSTTIHNNINKPTNKNKPIERPPIDVYHRDLPLYRNPYPSSIQLKKCSCAYKCSLNIAPAVINCYSCGSYEPEGTSYYCQECFDARHPWYRVQHYYSSIQYDDMDINYDIKKSRQSAEMSRYTVVYNNWYTAVYIMP